MSGQESVFDVVDDEACELMAISALAAAEAGAPPSTALTLALGVASQGMSAGTRELSRHASRLLFSTGDIPVIRDSGAMAAGHDLIEIISSAEKSGDDLSFRLKIYLENSFDRREHALRKRIETVPVYMIVVLVLFFMPAILILLVGPAFLALLRVLYDV